MYLPDSATLQLVAAYVSVLAALGGLVNVLVGLSSTLTGRDHWPRQLKLFRRRTPASPEDQRRYGMAVLLNGAAILIIIMGLSVNIFGARDHSQGEPLNTLRFVLSVIGFAAALACIGGSYRFGLTVRYTDPAPAAGAPPTEPSI
jgi:hypothetical protein